MLSLAMLGLVRSLPGIRLQWVNKWRKILLVIAGTFRRYLEIIVLNQLIHTERERESEKRKHAVCRLVVIPMAESRVVEEIPSAVAS